MNSIAKILWVDDEIEFLKPHILFLKTKGYEIETCNNGYDALELVTNTSFDLIILDEMMPGMTGLETLPKIKDIRPTTPVIMVTKSEEENIMDRAVGNKIADYIIKPVNPNQVLLSIKKNVHAKRLETETSSADYRSEFGQISSSFTQARTFADWIGIYKKLYTWNLSLTESQDEGIRDVLNFQMNEANNEFAKFIRRNYIDWISGNDKDAPTMSHNLMKNRIFNEVDKEKTTFLLIDNFRYDQWRAIAPMLHGLFDVEVEDFYCSILPTATQYARNAIFAGLTPLSISRLMPDKWLNDHEEGGKNLHEEEFLARLIQSQGKGYTMRYDKILRSEAGRKLIDNLDRICEVDLSVVVYNFLDILSHARTETDIIRELAEDEAAFRSLTRSWFEHSDLFTMLRMLSEAGRRVVISSDHGTIRVDNPVKVVGDKETSTNLRYKLGRNLNYNSREVFEITNPEEAHLPKSNISSSYIFAYNRDFFVYPNKTNQFVRYYKNTFQHGGISMEEMIVPYIVLSAKK